MNEIESPRVTRLPSGLTIITDPMIDAVSLSLGVWVNAGARHETPEMNGVSHLLEHMAFKGTKRRSAMDIASEMEAVGGQFNAYTSREHTAYYVRLLKEDRLLALDIIADILQHSTLDEEELNRERAVILQEIAQSIDTPDDIIFDHFQEVAYPGQSLGRTILGTTQNVRSMSRDSIAAYMKQNYSADRMILSASGAVSHDQLVEEAACYFDSLPPSHPVQEWPARYGGGDYRESRDLEQVHLVLGFNGVSFNDPDYYAANLFSGLLGGGMSSRLFQEVREKRGLVYTISSFLSPLHDGGLFAIYAGTGEQEAAEVIPIICDELLKATQKVTPEEIDRARAQLRASILMAQESNGARCEQAARHMLAYGRLVTPDEIIAGLEAVDEQAVLRAAKRIVQGLPSFAAIGPLNGLEDFGKIQERLKL